MVDGWREVGPVAEFLGDDVPAGAWCVGRALRSRLMRVLTFLTGVIAATGCVGRALRSWLMRVLTLLTGAVATAATAAPPGGRGGGGARGRQSTMGRGRGPRGGRNLPWLLAVVLLFMMVAATEGRHTQEPTHSMADLPSVVVRSVNVTSLEAHWSELEELQWDLLLVQEPRAAPDSPVFRRDAAKGIQVRPGPRTGTGELLVCAFCRTGSLGNNLPQGNVELGRAQYFTWHPGGPL